MRIKNLVIFLNQGYQMISFCNETLKHFKQKLKIKNEWMIVLWLLYTVSAQTGYIAAI